MLRIASPGAVRLQQMHAPRQPPAGVAMPNSISQQLIGLGLRNAGETVETLVVRLRKVAPGTSAHVVVAHEDDVVSDASKLFEAYDVHHLPIVDGTQVIGIVSSSDLLKLFQTSPLIDPAETTLGSIMTRNPRVVTRNTPVREVITILAKAPFHSLPVVDDSGAIWDILTTRDLVRYLKLIYEAGSES
jgi:CBS domain-containing membrane protein